MPKPPNEPRSAATPQDLSSLPPERQKSITIADIGKSSVTARAALEKQIADLEAQIVAIQESAGDRGLTEDESEIIAKLVTAEGPLNEGITQIDRVAQSLLEKSADVRRLRDDLSAVNGRIRTTVDSVRGVAATLEQAAVAIDTIAKVVSGLAQLLKFVV